ncbi:hypothetical protein NE237_012470 [Protea cynaroides]|uniref:FLZ-type domain-containing protein n=1 Tax=Protea cynaroides TaxID=273540 RepID=A0A9Q0GWX5_9MAGN|nr:hypothetical protein NE237_012470 [Protea cynaroides]
MSVKRSRIASSVSLGEINLYSMVRPIGSPPALCEKTAVPRAVKRSAPKFSNSSYVEPEKSCRRILTIASPVRESRVEDPKLSFDAKVGGFLEECYLCKKKIGDSDEVFMYSYLRAFCSSKCRDQQIDLDRGKETSAGDSRENAILRHWEQNLKGRFGAQNPQNEKDMVS